MLTVGEEILKDYTLLCNYFKELNKKKKFAYSFMISTKPECLTKMGEMDIVRFAIKAQGEAKVRLKEYLIGKYGTKPKHFGKESS